MENLNGKFHLIGIKGTGMSALAAILDDLGYTVTGSDVENEYFTSKKLQAKGLKYSLFSKSNITNDKVYIASSCYDKENIEVFEVLEKGYPFFYYHDFIESFFRNKIGISGTHGKTTTTSLVANLFSNAKISYLIGDGTGKGELDYEYFIFEACEYKNHFLKYNYKYLVINNIDFDHPDFFNSINDVKKSFQEAANNAEFLILNNDDINTKDIICENKLTFGFSENSDLVVKILEEHNNGYLISVKIEDKDYQYYLPFSGKYMIYNFMASLSVYYLCGYSLDEVQDLILRYDKPSRRMQEYFYYNNIIIDDYAHHPVEITACISAIKQKYPEKELIVIFQPHTYSRTLALKDEFRESLKNEKLYLVKTFTSKREGINKDLEKEVLKIFPHAKRFKEKDIKTIKRLSNKVILFLGAGDIDKYIENVVK